jgi:hypothetical protein
MLEIWKQICAAKMACPPCGLDAMHEVCLLPVSTQLKEEFHGRNIRHPSREVKQCRSAVPKRHW